MTPIDGATPAVPAGWYPDNRDADRERYWDGQRWTDQARVVAPQASAWTAPPPPEISLPDQRDETPSTTREGFSLPGQAEQPEKTAKVRFDKQPAPLGTQCLTKWTGRKHRTKKIVLNAACQGCGHKYQLNGDALNDYAKYQSGWAVFGALTDQLVVWGDKNSKNTAQELRYRDDKAKVDAKWDKIHGTEAPCVCPACRSNQVLVESPK